MVGVTEVSLTHHKMIKSIMLIMKHVGFMKKTQIQFFNDEKPFKQKYDVIFDIETYNAIVSEDRRSLEDQTKYRIIVLGLSRNDGNRSNCLVKLSFKDNTCKSEDVEYFF